MDGRKQQLKQYWAKIFQNRRKKKLRGLSSSMNHNKEKYKEKHAQTKQSQTT